LFNAKKQLSNRTIAWAVAGFFLCLWFLQLLKAVYSAPVWDEENYVLNSILRVRSFSNPYVAVNGFLPSVYTPLFFLICAPFTRDVFFPRLASLACFAAFLFLWARLLAPRRHPLWILLLGLACFTHPDFSYWVTAARIDLMALALTLGGIVLFLKGSPWCWFLYGLAFFTKETYCAAPLATFIVSGDWKNAARCLAVCAAVLLGIQIASGGSFFNALAEAPNLDLSSLFFYCRAWVWQHPHLAIALGLAALTARYKGGFIGAYAATTLLFTAFNLAHSHSSSNHILELTLAASLSLDQLLDLGTGRLGKKGAPDRGPL
jgi:hypothetical protein